MEYEIFDEGEDALFDDSTNPGLQRERHPPRPTWPANPGERRRLQQAELIPEEEHQLA